MGLVRTAGESLDELGAGKEAIDPSTQAEGGDLNFTAVFIVGAGLLLSLWAIIVALYPLFTYFKYERTGGKAPSKVLAYVPPLPPYPRNESAPFIVLKQFRAREEAALNSYRWVDRGKGIVSIPIAQAIRIVAQRGIPPSKPGGTKYYHPSAGDMNTGLENKVERLPR
jgi:hypothetical protein